MLRSRVPRRDRKRDLSRQPSGARATEVSSSGEISSVLRVGGKIVCASTLNQLAAYPTRANALQLNRATHPPIELPLEARTFSEMIPRTARGTMESDYIRFAGTRIRERDINELGGIVRGVALDGRINQAEVAELRRWCAANSEHGLYREVTGRVERALLDGHLDDEERADLLWFCDHFLRVAGSPDKVRGDMQVLHGLLAGISADAVINEKELRGLQGWLESADDLKGLWQYDEIDSLATWAMSDGRVDATEHRYLLAFASQFLDRENHLLTEPLTDDLVKHGVCAVQPEIAFEGKVFVVTGESSKATREELHAHVKRRGGIAHPRVTKEVDYLVVAAGGSPAWAFSCYGRKIEAAVKLRRLGTRIVIVHEFDFWDALRG